MQPPACSLADSDGTNITQRICCRLGLQGGRESGLGVCKSLPTEAAQATGASSSLCCALSGVQVLLYLQHGQQLPCFPRGRQLGVACEGMQGMTQPQSQVPEGAHRSCCPWSVNSHDVSMSGMLPISAPSTLALVSGKFSCPGKDSTLPSWLTCSPAHTVSSTAPAEAWTSSSTPNQQ